MKAVLWDIKVTQEQADTRKSQLESNLGEPFKVIKSWLGPNGMTSRNPNEAVEVIVE